jgi:hypothetical protein
VGVAVVALVVYVATMAPGLTFEHYGTDGGDLIAAARTLGVPHPTGYPTYTLLAWLFTFLPVGTVAYRVNLMSALCVAGAVGLLCRSAQLLLPEDKHLLALSMATALTFAFSSLLWSQAVIGEVYALLTLFAALLLWLLVRWRRGSSDGNLWLAAFLLGLGLGNHLTLIFAAPASLILLWGTSPAERRRWLRARTLLPAAGLFLVGLGIYAYLPLAASHHPPVNWGNPQTWDRFLWMITAEQYQQFAFGLKPQEIPDHLSDWAGLIGDQFGWWGLAIALTGAWSWWQRDRWFILFSLAWMLPIGIYAFFYDTIDAHIYLLPAFLLLALWWGEGARYLLHLTQRLRPIWQRLALIAIIALPFVSLALHWQASDLSDERFVHTYIDQALEPMAPGGMVIVRGDGPTFALWYAVYAEKRRPDIAVVSGPLLAYIWYRDQVRYLYPDLTLKEPTGMNVTTDDLVRDLIADNLTRRPIYATDPSEAWKSWFDFVQEGEAPLYRTYPKTKWERGG